MVKKEKKPSIAKNTKKSPKDGKKSTKIVKNGPSTTKITKTKNLKNRPLRQSKLNFGSKIAKINTNTGKVENHFEKAIFDDNWKSIKKCLFEAKLSSKAHKLTHNTNFYRPYFEDLAETLLNQTILTVNFSHKFRIFDVEFYLNDGLVHLDGFLSEIINSEQKMSKSKIGEVRENAKWSITPLGLFITFSQALCGKQSKGRIHIKSLVSLYNMKPNRIITGSSKVL